MSVRHVETGWLLTGLLCVLGAWTAAQPALLDPDGALGAGRSHLAYVERTVPKFHGLHLDMRHRLQLREEAGVVTVRLQSRVRPAGGALETYNPATGGLAPVIRHGQERDLLRIAARVLVPAAPNYVRNPGRRYRVLVEGLAVAPDYVREFEVDAYDALDALFAEAERFMAEAATEIERDAVYYGFILAARALNESGYFPARIPVSVLRGKVGEARIQGQHLARGEQARLERFTDIERGIEAVRVQGAGPRTGRTDGAGCGRGMAGGAGESRPYMERQFRPSREDLRPPDPRRVMMREPGMPTPRSEQTGARHRALTVPETDYPAVSASQLENFRLFGLGEQSAMAERAQRGR